MTLSKDWQPPSTCTSGECVVARQGLMAGTVEISRRQPGLEESVTAFVTYNGPEWAEFVAAVKKGEYDL